MINLKIKFLYFIMEKMENYVEGKTIYIDENFNRPLTKKDILFLEKFENIYFGFSFNRPIGCSCDSTRKNKINHRFPNNIKIIKFDTLFNSCLGCKKQVLPDSLTHLYMGCEFNKTINFLPESLVELHFEYGSKFNCPVDRLPKSVKKITFGWDFNQPINNLPELVELNLSGDFNQLIDNLPNSLKILTFNNYSSFDKPIDFLPYGLEKLKLGFSFNQQINNLPNTLKEITLGNHFNQSLDNLPASIEIINLHKGQSSPSVFAQKILHLPKNVKEINFSGDYKYLEEMRKKFGDRVKTYGKKN